MNHTIDLPHELIEDLRQGIHAKPRERITVCHISEGAAWAGAEVQLATLLRRLCRYGDLAVHAILLQEGRLACELRACGVAVHVLTGGTHRLSTVIGECTSIVRAQRIRILHSHSYKSNLISFLVSRICKVPHLVRTEHGHPEPYSISRHPKHWCVLVADRLAANWGSTHVVTVSSDLGACWAGRVGTQSVTVMPNGVDLETVKSQFSSVEAKKRLGISEDSTVIGIAARLETIKRHDLFIATAAHVAQRITNAKFIIAGGGRQHGQLERLIEACGLGRRVLMTGEREDVYDVLRAMDIVLICSDHEGIPMVMLEAMSLGIPVVSRAVGGIPEVIRNGRSGILVDSDSSQALGDACVSLCADHKLYSELQSAARLQIETVFSAVANAQAMLGVYRSLC